MILYPYTAWHVFLLILQQNVVWAQSHNDPYYSIYYWFSPGRIAGIAVGAAVLLLFFLSVLIMVCRRRKRARPAPEVAAPTPAVQPRPYPSWQPPQPYFGPYSSPGWYYPAPSIAPGQAKPEDTTPRGAAPPAQVRPASLGEGQRRPPLEPVRRPAPESEAQRYAPPGQVQRPASTSQVQTTTTPPTTAPQGQAQTGVHGPAQSVAQRSPSTRVRDQDLPPQPAYIETTQSGREPSPPPYSPPAEPQASPSVYTAR